MTDPAPKLTLALLLAAKERLDNCNVPSDMPMYIDGTYYAPIKKDHIAEFKRTTIDRAIRKGKAK